MRVRVIEERHGRLADRQYRPPRFTRTDALVGAAIEFSWNDEAMPVRGRVLSEGIGNSDLHVVAPIEADRRAEIATVVAERRTLAPRKKLGLSRLDFQRDRLVLLSGIEQPRNAERPALGGRRRQERAGRIGTHAEADDGCRAKKEVAAGVFYE